MVKYVITSRKMEGRQYKSEIDNLIVLTDMDRLEGMNPGALFLSSISSCKLVSFIELKEKYGMESKDEILEIIGESTNDGFLEGTRQPISRFKKISFKWTITTSKSEKEIMEYLKIVNAACTVGNSIDKDIEIVTTLNLIKE